MAKKKGAEPESAEEPEPKKERKKPGRKPTGRQGRLYAVWLPTTLAETMEEYKKASRLKPSVTNIIKAALEDFLTREGFPPLAEEG